MIHRARVVEKTGTARVADAPVGASSGSRRDRLKGEVSPGDASDRGASQNLYPLRQRCRSPGAGFQLPGARSHKNTSNLRWLPPVKSLRNRPRPSASPTPATAPPSKRAASCSIMEAPGAPGIASSAAAAAPSAGGVVLSHGRGLPLPAPDAHCFVRRPTRRSADLGKRVLGARRRRGGARRMNTQVLRPGLLRRLKR